MRAPTTSIVIAFFICAAASSALGANLSVPSTDNTAYLDYARQSTNQHWVGRPSEPQLSERPIGELIATKLGVAEGSAQLFRYRLENAPSNSTILRGEIDGGGIKLRLTW